MFLGHGNLEVPPLRDHDLNLLRPLFSVGFSGECCSLGWKPFRSDLLRGTTRLLVQKYTAKYLILLERVMGIEPTSSAWEAEVLPLNYTRGVIG